MSVLKIRDENGNFIDVPVIRGGKGEPGKDGKSAYQHAVDGGYTGTEQEFNEMIGSLSPEDLQTYMDHLLSKSNPHKVTAAQVGSLKIYNSFAAMNTDLGTTFGVATPIVTIIQALPNNTGLVADINAYGQEGEYPYAYGVLSIYKIRENRVTVEYVSNAETGSAAYNKRWIGQYNAGVFGGFKQVYTEHNPPSADDVGAVSKNGDTINGVLEVYSGKVNTAAFRTGESAEKSATICFTSDQNVDIRNNANGSYTTMVLRSIDNANKEDLLNLWVNGASYKVYGEHNLNPVQSEIKTYTGTGGSYQVTLTFSFTPKVVFIYGGEYSAMIGYGSKEGSVYHSNTNNSVSWSGNTLTWSGTSDYNAHNASGVKYTVYAIR